MRTGPPGMRRTWWPSRPARTCPSDGFLLPRPPRNTAAGSAAREGIARVRDTASKGLALGEPQLRALVTVWKQAATAALHHGIDEQPVLVDQAGLDQCVTE